MLRTDNLDKRNKAKQNCVHISWVKWHMNTYHESTQWVIEVYHTQRKHFKIILIDVRFHEIVYLIAPLYGNQHDLHVK